MAIADELREQPIWVQDLVAWLNKINDQNLDWQWADRVQEVLAELPSQYLPDEYCIKEEESANFSTSAQEVESEYLPLSDEERNNLQKILKMIKELQDPSKQFDGILAIAEQISPFETQLQKKVLDIILEIKEEYYRSKSIIAIAGQISSSKVQILRQALNTAQSIEREHYRAEAIAAIVARIAPTETQLLKQALNNAQAMEHESSRSQVLIAVIARIFPSDTQLLKQSLNIAQALEYEESRLEVIKAVVAQKISPSEIQLLKQSLNNAQEFEYWEYRSQALAAVASQILTNKTELVLKQALNIAKTIKNEDFRAEAIATVAAKIVPSETQLLKYVLDIALSLKDEYRRAKVMLSVIKQIPSSKTDLLKQSLDNAQEIRNEEYRFNVIAAITNKIPDSETILLKQALDNAQLIENEYYKVPAIVAVATQISSSETDLLQQILDKSKLIKDEEKRLQVIASVANQIFTSKNELLKKAFDEVAQSIQNKDFQLLVVPIIYQADITESKLFKKILDATTSIKDEEYRSKVISEIATHIPSSEIKLLKHALDKTQTIEFESFRLKARESIVKQFPDDERQLILKEDLDADHARLKQELNDAMQVEDEDYRWQAMAEVATKIVASDPQLLKQALDVTQAITDEYSRSSSLAAIAAHLPIDEKESAIQISLSLENKQHRIIGLTNIAFQSTEFLVLQCPQAQISTVLETIPKGKTSADKAKLLSALAPRLSIGLFPKALKLIQTEITHPAYQAEAVGNLAPYLPYDQLSDAIDLVQDHIVGFSYSTDALCNLIPHLSIKELRKALEVGKAQIYDLKLRTQIFLAVAKRLNSIIPLQSQADDLNNQKKDLIQDLLRLTHLTLSNEVSSNDNSIAEIVTAIAPNLNHDEILTGMLENIVPNIKSEFYLAQALASIAPYLYPEKIDYFSQLAESLQQESPQAKAFSSFMSVYPDKQFPFIVSLQRSSSNPIRDVEIALIIACRPHPKKEIHLDQLNSDQTKALHLIRLQNRDYDKANYLIQLAPHLLPSQAIEAQSIVQEIDDVYHKARSLVILATYFPQSRSEALHQIEQVKNKRPVEYEPRDKYLIQYIELLCEFTTIVPEQIPALLKTVEEWSKVNSFDSENIPTDPDRKKYKRTIILKALKPHLPIRLSREIDRETSIGKAPQDLWERCLFVLRNEYRQALKSGSFRNDATQDEDLLNLKDEINALTEMLLMRDLTPPVAVGILGGWGGGKSYMMHLMQKHMVEIRSRGLDPVEAWGFKNQDDKNPDSNRLNRYVGHIYQIKFDAWTYAKSNLWASLMQTIFFELDRQITLEHQIQTVLNQTKGKPSSLDSQSGAIWQALYDTNEEDRKWFLKNVLTEEALEKWEIASQNQSNADQLWDLFASSEQKMIEELDNLQSQLQAQKKALQKSRIEVLEKGAKYAFFSTASQTAIAVLNERFGTSFTKDIQEKVIKQLSTNIKDYKETQDQASQWGNSIKADIESVFEKQDGNINSLFINEFARKNLLFIFLCFLLILAAILFPLCLANMGVNSIVQTFAGIVPLLSAIPIAQGLLKKGQTIYRTHLIS